MTDRAEIVRILEATYAARKTGDIDRILEHFSPAGQYAAIGAPPSLGREAQVRDLGAIVREFELLDYRINRILVEGSTAAVHWHGKFRSTTTGKTGETDLLDLVEIKDGRVASFHNFFDTALAQRIATK
jgi:ketosteroid isomerase-like protein